MTRLTLTVENANRIHARPASEIVRTTGKYPNCEILIKTQGGEAGGTSIMGILMLKILCGTEVEIIANGEGETEASAELEKLFKERFGLEE
jgi:phosphocarrier protein